MPTLTARSLWHDGLFSTSSNHPLKEGIFPAVWLSTKENKTRSLEHCRCSCDFSRIRQSTMEEKPQTMTPFIHQKQKLPLITPAIQFLPLIPNQTSTNKAKHLFLFKFYEIKTNERKWSARAVKMSLPLQLLMDRELRQAWMVGKGAFPWSWSIEKSRVEVCCINKQERLQKSRDKLSQNPPLYKKKTLHHSH